MALWESLTTITHPFKEPRYLSGNQIELHTVIEQRMSQNYFSHKEHKHYIL